MFPSSNISKLFNLEKSVAIVTGGGAGIGRAISLTLADCGADVIIADIRTKDAEKVTEEIHNRGRHALPIGVDVTNPDDVRHLVHTTLTKFEKIDILVNNAGIFEVAPILEIDEKKWERMLDVNLTGCFLCSREAAIPMVEKRRGRIVNISSIAARTGGFAVGAHYSASKAGVISLTKSFAKALAPFGINVNSVAPHAVETQTLMNAYSKEQIASFKENIPLGRLGKPEDTANAVLFLVSDGANFITGQTIHVNGGALFSD